MSGMLCDKSFSKNEKRGVQHSGESSHVVSLLVTRVEKTRNENHRGTEYVGWSGYVQRGE